MPGAPHLGHPLHPALASGTVLSTVQVSARAGAIRVEISNPDQWQPGDVAILQNQEAKTVRQLGSLIFDTPLLHDYESGIEVRTLLPIERVEEVNGRLAATDEGIDGERDVLNSGLMELPVFR